MRLEQIFGAQHILCPVVPDACSRWLTDDIDSRLALQGPYRCIAGDMPVIMHENNLDSRINELVATAGLPVASHMTGYRDEQEYRQLVQKTNKKIVFQHAHLSDFDVADTSWIPMSLLSFLNNKKNLDQLAASNSYPAYRTIAANEINNHTYNTPCVIKVATDETTGAGSDVFIVHNASELENCKRHLAKAEEIIIQDYLEIKRILCAQFAIDFSGNIHYLGFSEQIANSDGNYMGNWFTDMNPHADIETLARPVLEQARNRGYYGIVGIDMAEQSNEELLIIDLNFRMNASTFPLLLLDTLRELTGSTTFFYRPYNFVGSYEELIDHAYKWLNKGLLMPLSITRSATASNPRIYGIIHGAGQQEILHRLQPLKTQGLHGGADFF